MNPPHPATRATGTAQRVLVGGALLLMLWSVVLPGPARSHPGGMPIHAQLTAEGEVVHLELITAEDDAALIGTSLGQLPEGAMEFYLGAADDGEPSAAQIEAF